MGTHILLWGEGWKEPAGIEGHHVDRQPLAEDRMRDGLVFDAEARRKDDATGNGVAYRGDTVIELEAEARIRRWRRGGLGVHRWRGGGSDSLFEDFRGNQGFPRFGERGRLERALAASNQQQK
jgi:hypothetical protein